VIVIKKVKEKQYTLLGILLSLPLICFCTVLESFLKIRSVAPIDLLYIQSVSPLLWLIDSSPIVLGLFGWLIDDNQRKNQLIQVKLEESNLSLKREVTKGLAMENHLRDMIDMYELDLNSAKVIQEFSLPEIPEMKEVQVRYRYQPLYSIGGDFLSFLRLDSGELSILIGDVVGHGISAALITSLVRVLANKACRNFGTEPKKYLENLNEEVNAYLPDDYYFTALYFCINFTRTGVCCKFSRGGHPYPIIYSAKDKQTYVKELVGIPLGLVFDAEYSELSVNLDPGDRIFMITDGLLEVRDINGKLLGIPGLLNIIQEANSMNFSLDDSLDFILEKTKSFTEEKTFIDDVLIFGIQVL